MAQDHVLKGRDHMSATLHWDTHIFLRIGCLRACLTKTKQKLLNVASRDSLAKYVLLLFTMAHNSSSNRSDDQFWLLWAPEHTWHTYGTHTWHGGWRMEGEREIKIKLVF